MAQNTTSVVTTNAEQDEAIAALRLRDGQDLLDRVATREHLTSQTNLNDAAAVLVLERSKLRTTLRRCAVAVVWLATCWSLALLTLIH